MHRVAFLIAIILVLSGCRNEETSSIVLRADFRPLFEAHQVEGSILIYDLREDTFTGYNAERFETAYVPASTYKIFNSLVALETGVLADENEVIPWDGKERAWDMWNQDHTLRSALKYSAVWFYQEVARRVGEERMQHYVDAAGYGNQDISGGIDMFWLGGGLRITSAQQIDILRRLYHDELSFSQRTMDIVKDIIVLEETEDSVFRGKTGWHDQTGWLVGYLEQNENVYFFATTIAIMKSEDSRAREAVTRDVFKHLGLM